MYLIQNPQPKLIILHVECAYDDNYCGVDAVTRFRQLVILKLLFEEFIIATQDPDKSIAPMCLRFPIPDFDSFVIDHFFKKDYTIRKDAEIFLGYVDKDTLMDTVNRVIKPSFSERFGNGTDGYRLAFGLTSLGYDAMLVDEDDNRILAQSIVVEILTRCKEWYTKQMHREMDRFRRNSNFGCTGMSPREPAAFQQLAGIIHNGYGCGAATKAPSPGIVLSMLSHVYNPKEPWKSLVSEEAAALFCLAAYLEDNLACTQIISPKMYSNIKDKTDVKVLSKDADLTMHQFLNRYYDKYSSTVPKCAVTYPVESTLGTMLIKIIQYMRGMLPNHVPGDAFLGINSDGGDLEFANQDYYPEHGGTTLSTSLVVYIIREVIYKGLWSLYDHHAGQLYSLMSNAPGCLATGYTMDYIEKMRVLNEYQAAFALQQIN